MIESNQAIFVAAPHANQFVDPLMIVQTCQRKISFLMAESSMKRAIIGFFGHKFGSIPVARAQDMMKKGNGKIYIDQEEWRRGERIVHGKGTKFLENNIQGMSLSITKKSVAVLIEKVESDDLLRIGQGMEESDVKLLAQDQEFFLTPSLNHKELYSKVWSHLANEGAIGIFPEGGSHDRSEFLPLKAGVTIMALGALAANPGMDLQIIPTGLCYFHRDRFRSTVVVEYGEPITVPPEYVEMYKMGGEEKRKACGMLLDTIHKSLLCITVTAPDMESLQLVQATRRLYRPNNRKLDVKDELEISRRFMKGYLKYQNNEQARIMIELKKKVLEYNEQLEMFGLHDHQLGKLYRNTSNRPKMMSLLVTRFISLILYSVVTLPGFILNLPVMIIAQYISKIKQQEALKASSVKIAAIDVIATWKLLVGLVLIPTLNGIYSFLWVLFMYPEASIMLKIFWILVYQFLLLPVIGYLAIRSGEKGMLVARSIYPLILMLFDESNLNPLIEKRKKLKTFVNDLVHQLGPSILEENSQKFIVEREELIEDSPMNIIEPNKNK